MRVPEKAGHPARQAFREEALELLQSYALVTQALNLGGQHTLTYRETLLRTVEVVQEQLLSIPEVTSYRLVGSFLRTIAEDLESTGEGELEAAGRGLLSALQRVKAQRVQGSTLPPAPVATGGSTASLSEQFVSHYKQQAHQAGAGGVAPAPPQAPGASSVPPAAPAAPAAEAMAPPTPTLDVPLEVAPGGLGGMPPAPPGPPPRAPATEDEHLGEEEPLPPGNLTAEAVFRLLLVECIRDGRFSRAETRCIAQIRDLLGLSLKRHSALLKGVQAEYEAGRIAHGEEMDPLDFFEACYRQAIRDGVVEPGELGLLGKLSNYLHLTRQEFEDIKARVAAQP